MQQDLFSVAKTLQWIEQKGFVGAVAVPLKEEEEKEVFPEVKYITTTEEVASKIAELLEHKATLAVDIETHPKQDFIGNKKAGLDPHLTEIRLVQFYGGGDAVYIFDVKALGGLEVLGEAIWEVPMVGHNAVFELKHLIHKGAFPKNMGCTMLLWNALNGGLISLKDLVLEVLGEEISKEEQTSDWGATVLSQEQLRYAAKDAIVTYEIFHKLYPQLKEANLVKTYNLMRDTQYTIARMALAGIGFDAEEHTEMIKQWEAEAEEQEREVRVFVGEDLNLRSPKQLGGWFLETYGDAVTGWEKTETGGLKMSADVLAKRRDLPVVGALLCHKELSTLLSKYGKKLQGCISPETGRLHASFRIGGTITGRFSCNDPNIQNPPRGLAFRRLFRAEEGNVLVVADFSQIELRVAALVSQDKAMLEVYSKGEDLHRKTAAALMGVSLEEVTKEQRQMAKAVNFGLLFGMGARRLADYAKQSYGVAMSEKEAKKARRTYLSTYPGIAQWQRVTAAKAEALQRVETPMGRIRDFSKEKGGYRYTEALNTPVQGGAAEVLLCSLVRLGKALDWEHSQIVNVVHDEIVVECREELAGEIKGVVEECMVKGFLDVFPGTEEYTKDLVEAHFSGNWGDAK